MPSKSTLIAVAYLFVGFAFFVCSLVLQLGFTEAFQASMWMLFLTLICCSLAYNKVIPRVKTNMITAIVGSSFLVCIVLAAAAFAAGLATKTIDRTAFGWGLATTILGIPLIVIWTKASLAPRVGSDLAIKSEDEVGIKNTSGRITCLDSKACTICANIWWILLGIFIVIFTAEVIGEVADTRILLPSADQFALIQPNASDASGNFNSALTGTSGRDDPRIKIKHDHHVICNGTGSPLVVLDHGRGGSIWDWSWVQRLVVDHVNGTKVCAFSRAGYGFSERGDRPRSAAQAALEMKAMLQALNLDVPFIHVGHSWGGMSMRMYQKMYPSQVLAQVFVDAVHVDCLPLCQGDKPTPSGIYRFFAALAGTGIPRALAATGSLPLNGSGLLAVLPEDVRAARLAAIVSPQFWQTWTDENEELSLSCDQVKRLGNTNITTFKVPIRNVMAGEGIHVDDSRNYTCGRGLALLSNPPGNSVIVDRAPHIELLFDKQFAVTVAEEVVDVIQGVREAP